MTEMQTGAADSWTPPSITSLESTAIASCRACIDGKAKPPGSLGRIEELAIQLGAIASPADPSVTKAVLLVFAADHGLVEEGVSQFPSAVTTTMVRTYLAGRAFANAFGSANDIAVRVVDCGVDAEFAAHDGLINAKIARGTRNAAREPAMSIAQVRQALDNGVRIASEMIDDGADVIALGEMGIGNTAASSLILHRLTAAALDDCIGVGAGQNEDGMMRKRKAIHAAAARSKATAPIDVLAEFGGFEIATMAGAILGAAARKRPVVVDGFITTAAALVAARLSPAARDYCIFSHHSAERGHHIALDALQAEPLLSLGMRLGEGTGALLAIPLIRAASRIYSDVADLADVLAGNIK